MQHPWRRKLWGYGVAVWIYPLGPCVPTARFPRFLPRSPAAALIHSSSFFSLSANPFPSGAAMFRGSQSWSQTGMCERMSLRSLRPKSFNGDHKNPAAYFGADGFTLRNLKRKDIHHENTSAYRDGRNGHCCAARHHSGCDVRRPVLQLLQHGCVWMRQLHLL